MALHLAGFEILFRIGYRQWRINNYDQALVYSNYFYFEPQWLAKVCIDFEWNRHRRIKRNDKVYGKPTQIAMDMLIYITIVHYEKLNLNAGSRPWLTSLEMHDTAWFV